MGNNAKFRAMARKLAAVLLALVLICALAAVPAGAAYGKGTKFVVLGDSIPAGEGASEEAKAYARLIADKKGFALSNLAVGGHKSSDLLEILANDAEAKKAIRNADIIDLNIGGNDLLASNVITLVLRVVFLKDSSTIDPYIAEFSERFEQIIKQIRKLNGSAKFIVQTLYNCMEGIPLVGDAYEIAVTKLNAVYYDYLKAHPGAYEIADIYGAYKGRDGLVFRDRLHPSDAGHEKIAEVLTAMIDSAPKTQAALTTPVKNPDPNLLQKTGSFLYAAYDYLGYWLSIYTPWELAKKAFSFM